MNSAPPEAPLTEPRYLPWGQTARVPLQGLFHEYLSVCSEQIAFPSCFACHDTRWEVAVCSHGIPRRLVSPCWLPLRSLAGQ